MAHFVNLTYLESPGQRISERLFSSGWPLGVSVGDGLDDVHCCGRALPTVGGTIPWAWVPDHITVEKVSQLSSKHTGIHLSLLWTVGGM